MGSNRSVLGLLAPFLVLAVVPSVLVSAGASRAAASVCGSLKGQTGALPANDELSGVSYVSPGETWAVGNVGAAQRANQTLIEQYNGSAWSVVPSPDQGAGNNALNGVSMIPGAGWAVGYAQVSGKYTPLALGWDGTQWSIAATGTFPSDALFTGVDTQADGSAWAVGFQRTAAGTRQTLIEQESGGTWTPVASPNDGTATDNSLTAIAGNQDTGLWAVGWRESASGLKPVILRYDTTQPSPTWVSVTDGGGVPAPGAIDTVLTGVDVLSADDVWAVGYYFDGSVNQPLALHWDGSTWSNNWPIPGAGMLRKVTALAPDNVWAAGTVYDGTAQVYKSLVEHFDGTSWTPALSANAPQADTEIIGLATDPAGSSMTLVGRQGSKAIVEQASCPSGPLSLGPGTLTPTLPVPDIPGVGPTPNPPPNTPPATTPIPVTITDQASAAGIDDTQDWTFSAAVADFNGDSWPDIFIARHWHTANLWLNNQDGTFSPSDTGYFSSTMNKDRHDCLAADFDQDGLQDMFCSVGADRGSAAKANALYIQQHGGTFADQAYQEGVTDPWGRGRYGAVLDANNDGYPDIFYGTESLRPDGMPSIDRFYINTGQGSFVDDPAMGLDMNIGSLCAHTVDYNNDGWPDLLVCGETGGLHLFRNDQGHGFTDVSSSLGTPIKAVDAAMVDINHDDLPDLITLTGSVLADRLQLANHTFGKQKIIHQGIKSARSLAIGDVNGDNNPDIYVVGGRTGGQNAPDYLFTGNATGTVFTSMTIPQASVGGGDTAYPIDYTKDGLASFLVLNGQVPNTGPIQLLTPQPSSALARMTSFKPGAAP
jgi:hypothetical protein